MAYESQVTTFSASLSSYLIPNSQNYVIHRKLDRNETYKEMYVSRIVQYFTNKLLFLSEGEWKTVKSFSSIKHLRKCL